MNVQKSESTRTLVRALQIITLLGAVIAGTVYWLHIRHFTSTEDAYIKANVVEVAPQITGKIKAVHVHNFQDVAAQQPLFDIDDKPFRLTMQKAEADKEYLIKELASALAAINVSEASIHEKKAQVALSEKNAKRILALVKQGRAPKAKGDEVKTQLEIAKSALVATKEQAKQAHFRVGVLTAQIKAAQATLAQTKLDLGHTHIVAPDQAMVTNLTMRPGSLVNAHQPQFSLVETKHWWVEANLKETQLAHVKPGQTTQIILDMYPSHHFTGKVESISRGSGASFSLFPPENATGNWVKVTQRFPVKISIQQDPQYPLRLGASAKVRIDIRA